MRTSKNTPPPPTGYARMNFVFISAEGDTGAITKSLESLHGALRSSGGYFVGQPAPRLQPALPATATAAPDDQNGVAELPDPQSTLDEVETPTPPPVEIKRHRTAPKIPALNQQLSPGTAPSLTDFVATTKVNKDSPSSDHAIVISMWLRQARQHAEMSGSDFYTCCKFMQWPYPTDITSTLRALKHADKLSGTRNKYKLTIIGEQHFDTLKK